MEIFANHAHLMPSEVRPDASLDQLLRRMDDCGIARAVCFAPFPSQLEGTEIADGNAWLADQLAGRDTLVGLAVLDPLDPASVPALRRVVELGLRGLKLHPAVQSFDVADPRAMEFYAAATEAGLPLNFHTGVHGAPLRQTDPLAFDEIRWRVPEARVVIEHLGTLPFYYQMLGVIANANYGGIRFHAGMTTLLNPEVRLWYLGEERVRETAWRLGADCLIYGLDFPWNPTEVTRHELAVYRSLDLPPGGVEALLGGNLAALLGLPRD